MLFLGHNTEFWIALLDRAKDLNVDSVMQELVVANAKVRYYEMKLDEMANFRWHAGAR